MNIFTVASGEMPLIAGRTFTEADWNWDRSRYGPELFFASLDVVQLESRDATHAVQHSVWYGH